MVMSEAQKSAMPVDHCKIVPYERSRELVAPTSLRAQIFHFRKPTLFASSSINVGLSTTNRSRLAANGIHF